MKRQEIVNAWRKATGLPFHPASATERGLIAVFEEIRVQAIRDRDGEGFYLANSIIAELRGDHGKS